MPTYMISMMYVADVILAVALTITSSSELETEPSTASQMDDGPFPEQEKRQEVQAKPRNQRKKVLKTSLILSCLQKTSAFSVTAGGAGYSF